MNIKYKGNGGRKINSGNGGRAPSSVGANPPPRPQAPPPKSSK